MGAEIVAKSGAKKGEYPFQFHLLADRRLTDVIGQTDGTNRTVLYFFTVTGGTRGGDQTIGVLDVQSAEVGRFQDSDLFVIRTLADQIAV